MRYLNSLFYTLAQLKKTYIFRSIMIYPVRFITAAALFDGHDVSINIIRRLLQAQGAEVIHLGHNRGVQEVVKAAIEEDADGIAISSYQGGHNEYFAYMMELLSKNDASHIKIFGGGGGVITPQEIRDLEMLGAAKIFSPEDGQALGLKGMIAYMIDICQKAKATKPKRTTLPSLISCLEEGEAGEAFAMAKNRVIKAPIVGFTGTGGAGKSSLIDEVLLRFLNTFSEKKVAVLSIDPTKTKSQGALLGDRIRLNQGSSDRAFVRSLATRSDNVSISRITKDALALLSQNDFDLVILETAGIGQADSSIKDLADIKVYVMTPEYGADSQLEKIAMMDYADLIVINKFDKPKSLDAQRAVQKAFLRTNELFHEDLAKMPVYGTCAHLFGDLGTNRFFNRLMAKLNFDFKPLLEGSPASTPLIPKENKNYLAKIVKTIQDYHKHIKDQSYIIQKIDNLENAIPEIVLEEEKINFLNKINKLKNLLDKDLLNNVEQFNVLKNAYKEEKSYYTVRKEKITVENYHESLSHLKIPKVKAPEGLSSKDTILFVGKENLPGYFPFTEGVFPFKRQNEDPTRMFAGEGHPERTNFRFHYLSLEQKTVRLSTAFDSVTLYGENPDVRPDIFGKIGNAGVSVCSLDDAKRLYSGFDLSSPNTSVSMTINGPAPTMLAFFFNAAIDFAVEKELKAQGQWLQINKKIDGWFKENNYIKPAYRGNFPKNHNGQGLGFLGVPASLIVEKEFYEKVKIDTLKNIRGTIQADILKEDQAQNTCIFSTEFSLIMMKDTQEYFIKNNINNFYSVSISGYHIAEAGANPISQLAFTLANGFTLLEYYRSQGMKVDDFAKNFSFFFSNGLDPEYAVLGRVARRIWAIALKFIYGADERSQKLKYHIQTSGRSLHAQEMTFNDIRTTLQALYALADNCNSLHTNAFDEAITTPTEESVRKAVAIQHIINQELGLLKNENPWAGSYFLDYLTDLVEEKVLERFLALDDRGGVLGAMESMYQRNAIQEESLYYEEKKHSGEFPIVGINTFLSKHKEEYKNIEIMRSTLEEKNWQVEQIGILHKKFINERKEALANLKIKANNKQNTFYALMEATKYCSLGEITHALFDVGGAYRRAM